LRHGSFEAPLHLDEHVVVFLRRDGKDIALVAANNAAVEKRVSVTLPGFKQALDLAVPPLGGMVMLGSSNKLTVAAQTQR
jgi:hypothetical protein